MIESAATCTTEIVSSFYVAYTSQISLSLNSIAVNSPKPATVKARRTISEP
jgi:hypothetical protein